MKTKVVDDLPPPLLHYGWPATIRRLTMLYDELAALAPRRHTAREQRS